jgi:hypothetical protein
MGKIVSGLIVFLSVAFPTLMALADTIAVPELDVMTHCEGEAAKGQANGPPRRPLLDYETLLDLCVRSEIDYMRNAKWRLRWLSIERGQECVEVSLKQGSYLSLVHCLDRFSLPLR